MREQASQVTANADGFHARESRIQGLNREIQAKIGQQLRAMFDEVVQEGVPDRFADASAATRHPGRENSRKPER